MSLYVPRVGTFDPGLPEWLVLGPDGRLYNINAVANRLSLVEPWVPPDDWRGGDGIVFVPEGAKPAPPPAPSPVPAPLPYKAVGMDPVLAAKLLTTMRAIVVHDTEMLRLAQQRVSDDEARMQESLRLAVEADKAFDAVLADLLQKVNQK